MDKQYNHQQHENQIYSLWEKENSFQPKSDSTAETFTIIMPPPNANDPLHIGHAMFVALEDILIRYHRMTGKASLWLPGTDHAGIETQFVFEKKLAKNNQSRFDFDRETLYQKIWDYVQENSDVAVNQLKALGASADWSRFTFMLEPKIVDTVLDTFIKLNQKDLVYRDVKLVNYCTFCGTAFSTLETDHQERVSPFFTIKYGPFEIGTVRPETKFRDTALAVNPNDSRYKQHIGKTFEIMGLLGPIQMTVIGDADVDPEFGTGIMKVTPAHDPHDFELGKIHNLPVTPIIDFHGRMDFSWFIENPENQNSKYLDRAKKYHGLKVAAMREEMKKDLEEDGLLVNYNPKYTHNLSVCYRCQRPLEPLPLPQFFVKVAPLVEPVLKGLEKKEIKVIGSGHDKILLNWLTNLKDWNISRQIVWGIRMPVWYEITDELEVIFIDKDKKQVRGLIGDLKKNYQIDEIKKGLQTLRASLNSKFVISKESPSDNHIQETDTFDTWFSSAQWPFSTLKNSTENDFDRFYPTQVMETGYDILPFWVMRMLMMGKFVTGDFPFKTVYLHGLIRDQKGQKMSKSKGNVINPITVIEKYGADALRMALVIRSSPGLDKNVGESDFKAMRNFTNKIWNATRFIMLNLDIPQTQATLEKDAEFYQYLDKVVLQVSDNLNNYRMGLSAEIVYNEFWHWYCDTQIEAHKQGLISTTALITGLITFLKLLHPFVPFISETLFQNLKEKISNNQEYKDINLDNLLINSSWPKTTRV